MLITANKSFWADLLGVGNFYYKLAIQIIEVGITSRHINGGLIDMNDLLERLQHKRTEVSASPSAGRDIAAFVVASYHK
jgi:ESCRT-II complex subunit VPS22